MNNAVHIRRRGGIKESEQKLASKEMLNMFLKIAFLSAFSYIMENNS